MLRPEFVHLNLNLKLASINSSDHLRYYINTKKCSLKLDGLSIDLVLKKCKFITFSYIIPRPFFPAVKRISKIYVLSKEQNASSVGLKYSIYNTIVCWFGLPFGPVDMLSSNRLNKTGVEISDMLIDNLTINDIKNGYIDLPIYYGSFLEISLGIKNELRKIIQNSYGDNSISTAILGYIKHSGKHYFYLGLRDNELDSELNKELKELFKKSFSISSILEVTSLSSKGVLQENLMQHGTDLLKN